MAKAPLRETLAAALLIASGWDGCAPLLDPMCGSGTIPIEGALLARRIAPGLANAERIPRSYAFGAWTDFEPGAWQAVVEVARGEIRPTTDAAIEGADRDGGAITAALANAERAGVAGDVRFEVRPLSAIAPRPGTGWLVTNPPYGGRVGERARLRDLYAALGNAARRALPDWTIALLSADRQLEAQTGLALQERLRTRTGGIPVRMMVTRSTA